MDYRIAIPTISRSKTIKEKTIGYLLRTDIDLSKIDIFFSNPDEIDDYKEQLKDLPIGNYIPTIKTTNNVFQIKTNSIFHKKRI